MAGLDLPILAVTVVVLASAGFIKGVFGLALPVVSVGILSAFLPVPTVLAIVILPIVASNLWQGFLTGNPLPTIRRFWPTIATLMTVLWLSAQLVTRLEEGILYAFAGFAVVLFSVTSALRKLPDIPHAAERWVGPVFGALGGFLGGLSAIWAPPVMVYFIMLRLPKEEFIRACGVSWFLAAIPMLFAHIQSGVLTVETAKLSALACVPVLGAMFLGERLRKRVPQERFHKGLLVVAFLIGLNLLRRAIF